MYARHTMLLAMVVALAVLAGCQSQQRMADASGHGVYLFGPTALPVGQEDLGYFASAPQSEPPLAMFDHQSVYIRSRIYDVEDNRAPGLSHQRRETRSEQRYLFQR